MPLSRFNLTQRELQVLWLLGDGKTNKEIAARLCVSEKTVEFHIGRLLSKLNVRTRTEAVLLIAQLGLFKKC
jgi:DNA-binding NarL/FixJ family response regulator